MNCWGEIFELFMGPKSCVELTPPRPGQLRGGSGVDSTLPNSEISPQAYVYTT